MAPLHWSPEITSAGAALEGATDDSEVPRYTSTAVNSYGNAERGDMGR
jgi:hypothetical protein